MIKKHVDIHALPITFQHQGQEQTITPVLLQDEQHLILVDCGYAGFVPMLEETARNIGFQLEKLTHIIVTHHDIDHIGALAELTRAYPGIEVIAYELEALYVAGKRKSLRLIQAEEMLSALPEEERLDAVGFISFLKSMEPAPVTRTVSYGERLPWCGGIEIVHTPGHMPGHISLYHPDSGTMIAGDAVVIEAGKLEIANPQFTLDMDAALASVERLMEYEIRRLVCYHGGWFLGDAKTALRELLHRYGA